MAYDALLVAALALREDLTRTVNFHFGPAGPVAVVAAQIAQESAFNPWAKSPVGALGLMQFMPKTATWAAGIVGPGSPLDPAWSLRAGVWYDRYLYDRVIYPSDCQRWGAALASYNGGLGWHDKRKYRAANPQDFWGSVRTVNPGVSPASQRENEDYPRRIVFELQPRFFVLGGRRVCP